jgi:hypothetical protein
LQAVASLGQAETLRPGASHCGIYSALFTSSLVDLGLLVQNHVQQGTVDFNLAVVINKTQFPKSVHEKLTRDRVVPIISASVSWLIFAMIGSGRPSLPKFARSRRVRASRFSLELNN